MLELDNDPFPALIMENSITVKIKILLVCVLAVTLFSCEKEGKVVQVKKTRQPAQKASIPKADESTSAERFGAQSKLPPGHVPIPNQEKSYTPSVAFKWTTPDGWKEAPPRSMREVNLKIGANNEAECYVTVLSGSGGGIVANVNRWRSQIALPGSTEEEISKLPKIKLLGEDAVYIELEGTYSGMGGAAQSSYSLIGAILEKTGKAYFVKMTGPSELLTNERDNFKAFCESLTMPE